MSLVGAGKGRLGQPLMGVGATLAAVLLLLLLLPLLALMLSLSGAELVHGLRHPLFLPALLLSLRTSLLSLCLVVLMGTPLAWWLSRTESSLVRGVELVVQLPIVVPPAVVGVALLHTFGRQGWFGPWLQQLGLVIPFSEAAVVLAQLVVSAPFFVQAAANAFRKIDVDTLIVARTLGASAPGTFFRIGLPIALPGLVAGASLSWARALGEFGATLLFAGNMPGRTQTMPLAIFTALETDTKLAVVLSVLLVALGGVMLLALRRLPLVWQRGGDIDALEAR